MKVILKKDYEKLGNNMDIITVKDGYARNYLIPEGIAVPATEANQKMVLEARRFIEKKEEKKEKEARQLAKKIENTPCTIAVKIKEGDEIYGSVSTTEISDFLKKEGFEIEKSHIILEDTIKQLGVYNVKIKLYRDISAKLKVWVVTEEK